MQAVKLKPRRAVSAPLKAAALHAVAGLVKDGDVPVGNHNLDGLEVVVTFVAGCAVIRDVGAGGDGFDPCPMPLRRLTVGAALLILSRSGLASKVTRASWKRAIRDAELMGRSADEDLPRQATLALNDIADDLGVGVDSLARKKTSARRIGLASAGLDVRRS